VAQRPEFTHRPTKHGLIGPFGGRQIVIGIVLVVAVAVTLVALTSPLGTTRPIGPGDPRATSYLVGSPTIGLAPGSVPPGFAVELTDGTTFQLTDLDGRPIRLEDYRGKAVWVTFWTTWCPPCQSETPVLRDVYAEYRGRGLELIAVDIQETVDVAKRYAANYGLGYRIGADVSATVFHAWRGYALPTHFFIGPEGTIRYVVSLPLDRATAVRYVESVLPAASPAPSR
jgi:thiol-disulfide isomerase/thioredoxin